MTRLLFLCSRNRLRSPTAELVFAKLPGIETASAGLASDAETPLDADLLAWADLVFVMESRHRKLLQGRFGKHLRDKYVICLDIPDDYGFMDPQLVSLLEERVGWHLDSRLRGNDGATNGRW